MKGPRWVKDKDSFYKDAYKAVGKEIVAYVWRVSEYRWNWSVEPKSRVGLVGQSYVISGDEVTRVIAEEKVRYAARQLTTTLIRMR